MPAATEPFIQTDIAYLTRRAQHERELAARARSAKAAMTHMYMAAAYANRVAELSAIPSEFEDLLDRLT